MKRQKDLFIGLIPKLNIWDQCRPYLGLQMGRQALQHMVHLFPSQCISREFDWKMSSLGSNWCIYVGCWCPNKWLNSLCHNASPQIHSFQAYNLMTFSKFTKICHFYGILILAHFLHLKISPCLFHAM